MAEREVLLVADAPRPPRAAAAQRSPYSRFPVVEPGLSNHRGFEPRRHDRYWKGTALEPPFNMDGGERGIRTLDGLLAHTPLAGERLRPTRPSLREAQDARLPNNPTIRNKQTQEGPLYLYEGCNLGFAGG